MIELIMFTGKLALAIAVIIVFLLGVHITKAPNDDDLQEEAVKEMKNEKEKSNGNNN